MAKMHNTPASRGFMDLRIKAAIIAIVYSIFGPLIGVPLAWATSEHGMGGLLIKLIFVFVAPPTITYSKLNSWLAFESFYDPVTGMSGVSTGGYEGLVANAVLWLIIGILGGALYEKYSGQ